MASLGKIARRSFLIGSAAIVGGVAFGAYKFTRPLDNPLDAGPGEAALNPFVFIDQAGVTIITPRAEMGQGVHTTLAALAAEELDVAWEDVRVLHGPPAQAYYNSTLMSAGLPMAEYNKSAFMHSVSEALGHANKLMGLQLTGGSTSMTDGYERLRHAGASARETLKLAAAQRMGVDAGLLKTENGAVIAPDGTAVPYTELAEAAAGIEAPQVELRPKSEWKYLGTTMPRVDMLAKATGTAEFGVDVRVPDMKFATIKMSPRLGAPLVSMDAQAAEAMPGVERVIKLNGGFAVVARNTWLAFQAADAVEVQWGEAPYPHEQDEIWQAIEASFDGDRNSKMRDDGDADNVPSGATEITAEYRMPFLAHATMEPMNATALYTGDALEMWCGNQGPTIVRDQCAAAVGLEPEQMTLHTTLLGGGFGRRGESDFAVIAAQVAREMEGTPVQVTWSREEDMTHDFFRPAAIGRYRGAVQDGKAVLLDGKVAGPSVTFGAMKRMTGAAGADPLAFRLDLMRREHAPSAKVLEAVAEMSGWTGETPQGVGRGVAFTYSFGTPVAQVIEVQDEDGAIRIARAWIAADVGTALDPGNLEAQMYGGMIYGLSAAAFGEITFADGMVEQLNFPDYDALRIHNAPVTEVRILENNPHMGGAGEPGTPPSMSALTNAVVQIHDPQYQLCTTLQRQTRRALKAYSDDDVTYLVANIKTTEGSAFAARFGLPHVTLMFFDDAGVHVNTLRGPTSQDAVEAAFAAHMR